jgi:hypothetical protein
MRIIMQAEPKNFKARSKEVVKAFVFVGVGLVADTVKDVILDHVAPKRLIGDEVKERIWGVIDQGAHDIIAGLVPSSPSQPMPPRPDPYRSRDYYASEVRGRRITLMGPPQPKFFGLN